MSKMKIFGIGGMGCVLINKYYSKNIPFFAIDTCSSPYSWLDSKKLLIGKEETKGLGCGGFVEKGYDSAKKELSNNLNIFNNELNVFILGLGGGTGTGVIKYLNEILDSRNVIICTYPLNVEELRQQKANKVIDELKKSKNVVFLLNQQNMLKRKQEPIELFIETNNAINSMIIRILRNNNLINFKLLNDYSKNSNLIEINKLRDMEKYF